MQFSRGQLAGNGVMGTQKLVLFGTLRYATAATVQ